MMISVSVYGSVARRQTDELSDRDVLFLAQCENDASEQINRWRSEGWNVSFFTYQHFARLVEFQSLFVQHLHLEGRIIRDDDGILQRMLKSFVPAPSYRSDLIDALLPLEWIKPDEPGYWAHLCLGDILFVMARNAGILHAAEIGNYIFEYGAIVEHLARSFALSTPQHTALLGLRSVKAAYRSRSMRAECGATLELAIEALRIMRTALNQLEDTPSRAFVPNNYHALRRTELALVRVTDPRQLDRLSPRDGLFKLWRLICNPADYPKLRLDSDFLPTTIASLSLHDLAVSALS